MPQGLLVANMVYGAWRAGVHGNPMVLLMLLLLGQGSPLKNLFFWTFAGALVMGVAIVVAAFATMRGWRRGSPALALLSAMDACLYVAGVFYFMAIDGLSHQMFLKNMALWLLSVALVVLNVRHLRRAAVAARPGVPTPPVTGPVRPIAARPMPRPGARPTARPPALPAVAARPAWLYLVPVMVLLAWHWGGPFVSTATASRRGASAGERQNPPRIQDVFVLPLYDGKTTTLYQVPQESRPAGMDSRSFRKELAPVRDSAVVLVFGRDFRRVADQKAENHHLTVMADGAPLKIENELPIEDAWVELRVSSTVNSVLRQPGPHTLQVRSGPSATSESATLDLGSESRRFDQWLGSEPRIHHVAVVGARPGALTLKVLISGLCRTMPDRPGFCTPGFQSMWGEPYMEVPCTLTVLDRQESCRWRHPNVLETEVIYGKNEDASGFAQLEIGGRQSNRVEIRVHEMLAPWKIREEQFQEYYRGVAASPAAARLGPAGVLAHLAGPAIAVVLFLLLRGWRGQVVLKSVAALTLPILLMASSFFLILLPFPGRDTFAPVVEAITHDSVRSAPHFVEAAVVGALVGLCLRAIERRRTT